MPEFVKVAKITEIKPGRVKYVEAGKHRIALCNVDGEFYAIDNVCTHDGGPLNQGELEDDQIECPRHGARFNVRTGAVVTLPAVLPVETYPVRIEGTDIYIGI